ncbi:chromosome partitioning protein ParA, partial [Vibrio cholerae]
AIYMSKVVSEQSTHIKQTIADIVSIPSFCLTNGQLLNTGVIPYASRIFNSWNLDKNNTIEIETNEGRFIVDKTQNDAVSGSYLIEINGRMSINHIQRLPNKLAVVFGDSTVEVAEEDIKVVGRVAVTLKKD